MGWQEGEGLDRYGKETPPNNYAKHQDIVTIHKIIMSEPSFLLCLSTFSPVEHYH